MSTYALRGIDHDLIQRAKARAREAGTSLDVVLRAYLLSYAEGHETPAQQLAAQGGRARAEALTPEERSDAARHAVSARWEKRDATDAAAEGSPRYASDADVAAAIARVKTRHAKALARLGRKAGS